MIKEVYESEVKVIWDYNIKAYFVMVDDVCPSPEYVYYTKFFAVRKAKKILKEGIPKKKIIFKATFNKLDIK